MLHRNVEAGRNNFGQGNQRRLPERGEKEWILTLEESSISLKCPLGSGDLIFVNLVTKLSFWLRNLCEELEMILFKLTSGQAACQSQMKIMRWLKKAHVACSLFFFFLFAFTFSLIPGALQIFQDDCALILWIHFQILLCIRSLQKDAETIRKKYS